MRNRKIIRAISFAIFFGIGASTLYVSICCDELIRYYKNNEMLKTAQQSKGRLEILIADYEVLLGQLDKDPNLFIERIAPAAVGAEPADTNAIYPKITSEQLAAAREVLKQTHDIDPIAPVVPDWLSRCNEPRRRIILFLAGAFLIIVSFVWFGTTTNNFKQPRR